MKSFRIWELDLQILDFGKGSRPQALARSSHKGDLNFKFFKNKVYIKSLLRANCERIQYERRIYSGEVEY